MCAEHCWGWTRTPSGRALLPDLRETAKAELQSVESIEETERHQTESSDWNFVMFNEVQPVKLFDTLIPPQVPLITPFRSLTESSGTILTSEKRMGAISIPNVNVRLFDLKQAKQLGTAQRPAPQGAEVRSVRFWKKNVRSFSVFFFWCKAMQMQSKWRAEFKSRDHVWTWNNPRAAHGHLCAGDWSFFTKKSKLALFSFEWSQAFLLAVQSVAKLKTLSPWRMSVRDPKDPRPTLFKDKVLGPFFVHRVQWKIATKDTSIEHEPV